MKRLSVLYVEDEKQLAGLMKNVIGRRFGRFFLAYNGKEGLELFRRYRPDLVITDITMPGMDGLEMGRLIHELSPATPLIILSAYSDKDKLLGAIDVGVTKYFIKPFDPEELLEYLEKLSSQLIPTLRIAIRPDYLYTLHTGQLSKGKEPVSLTRRERKFIRALLDEPDNFLSADSIKELLWDNEHATDDALRVFINRLRKKAGKELIRNRSGEGYYLLRGSHPSS
jgi:DNA-binding response OmpR family regulator